MKSDLERKDENESEVVNMEQEASERGLLKNTETSTKDHKHLRKATLKEKS